MPSAVEPPSDARVFRTPRNVKSVATLSRFPFSVGRGLNTLKGNWSEKITCNFIHSVERILEKESNAKNRRSKAFVLLKISGVKVFYCDVIQVKNTISLYKYTINAFKKRTISFCRERQCLPNRAQSCIKDSSLRNQR